MKSICKIFTFLLLIITTSLQGQDLSDTVPRFDIFNRLSEKSENGGMVTLNLDERIKNTMENRFNKSNRLLKGWRIRIFRDNSQQGKSKAERVVASVKQNYPDLPVYLTYEAPYFYVSVGDYPTRISAEKMKRTLQQTYSVASLIETTIKFPPL